VHDAAYPKILVPDGSFRVIVKSFGSDETRALRDSIHRCRTLNIIAVDAA